MQGDSEGLRGMGSRSMLSRERGQTRQPFQPSYSQKACFYNTPTHLPLLPKSHPSHQVCQLHGGVFVKFGQYVASLVRIIPEEYTETLR